MNLKSLLAAFALSTLASVSLWAQDFTVLHSFTDMPDGEHPRAGLISGGNCLYGTTIGSGTQNPGTIWKINMDGSGYTTLKNCVPAEGAWPYGGLLLIGNTLFGVDAGGGGSGNAGVVFKINTDGTGYTILKDFNNSDGYGPCASLVTDGNALYGVTQNGIIFKLNQDGSGYTVLKQLDYSEGTDLASPLVLRGNTLFGVASQGGSQFGGTLFQINTDGSNFAVLKHFSASEGTSPAWLALDNDILYGMTYYNGTNGNFGVIYRINTNGSGFAVLRHFSDSDGSNPYGKILVIGDMLIGTTGRGGNNGHGTIFQMKKDGTAFKVLKDFSGADIYLGPMGSLVLQGDVLYGTTFVLGDANLGSIYKITVPSLPPAIATPMVNMTVASGSSPVLSVGVNGTPPFTWQWMFNGTNIDGATNATLTLANFSPANVGSYSVAVTNDFGGVISQSATVSSVDIHMLASVFINGPVGSNYVIQATSDLLSGWTTLTNLALPAQPYVYVDYNSATNRQQFYRAMPQ